MSPKRFNLSHVRNLNYVKAATGYECKVADDVTATITQNTTPTGAKVRNDFTCSVNGTKVGAGTLNDCKVHIGWYLLDSWSGEIPPRTRDITTTHVAEHRPIPEGEGYSLTVKVQRNKVSSDAVFLHVGRVSGADDHAAELALKAASMVDGMFHFEAHLEHDEGADGYDAYGCPERIENWICDGR